VCVKIDVSKFEQEPLRFDEEFSVDPDRLDCEQVTAPMRVRLKGEVRPRSGFVTVAGNCRVEGSVACSRCLEPVQWEVDEDLSVDYRTPSATPLDAELGLEKDDLDVAFLEGDKLDLAELAAEQILLALPMRVVCDESCAGLCPRCGANRNRDGACTCEPEVDPRWHALADLAGKDHSS
jgi:uncharacterized protein